MRVLLVEDSKVVVAYVAAVLAAEPDVELLGPVFDGERAVEAARTLRPDVVLMDLELPEMDGISAIWEIMRSSPTPIVVFSAYLHDDPERDRAFEAFEAGALEVLEKPRGLRDSDVAGFRERLVRTLRIMSHAKVVTRRGVRPTRARGSSAPPEIIAPLSLEPRRVDAVVVGSSTGGPVALHELLTRLPAPYPLPIYVAQHIVPGFEQGFSDWLSGTGHRVRVVERCVEHEPGVHLAPADADLRIIGDLACRVTPTEPGVVPSADELFRSAASRYGGRLAAILLSGMGEDGARGMLEVRAAGGLTIAQRASTCVIDGMPGAARVLGAAELDLPPREIAQVLERLARGAEEELSGTVA